MFETSNEFTVIFDSASDLDINEDGKWHFYQVKTDQKLDFTIKKLIDDKKRKETILEKMLKLKDIAETLNIVTNTSLKLKQKNMKLLAFLT